jgi:CRISPR-associated protein Csm3
MNQFLEHNLLVNRYRFVGTLELETALHVGSGQASSLTEASVVRGASGEPLIPGSSLKGALRSAVERIAPLLPVDGITSCQLIQDGETACLTTSKTLVEEYGTLQEVCEQSQRTGQPYNGDNSPRRNTLIKRGICTEAELDTPAFVRELPYRYLQHHLCDTCKLFGSTFFAAKVRVRDLAIDGYWTEMTEIRDGVGIDRDTETAVPKVKFDLEVVPSQTHFVFQTDAENLTVRELGLLCVGLQEFTTGMVPIGGRSTRGLGGCRLILDDVYAADFDSSEDSAHTQLLRYISFTTDEQRMEHHEPADFIRDRIIAMFPEEIINRIKGMREGGSHVAETS